MDALLIFFTNRLEGWTDSCVLALAIGCVGWLTAWRERRRANQVVDVTNAFAREMMTERLKELARERDAFERQTQALHLLAETFAARTEQLRK